MLSRRFLDGTRARPDGLCQVSQSPTCGQRSDSVLLERGKRVEREGESPRDRKTQRYRDNQRELERNRVRPGQAHSHFSFFKYEENSKILKM